MAAVKLSKAQATALGIASPGADAGRSPTKPGRRRGGDGPGRSVVVCVDCGVELVGETAQARHVNETGHCRQQLTLNLEAGR